jgi:hypothetical protein
MQKPTPDMLAVLGLQNLPEAEQQELLLDMQHLIFKGSVVRMLERMSEESKEAFNTYLESNPSEDDMMEYLEQNVPEAKDAIIETIADIKNDILAGTQP